MGCALLPRKENIKNSSENTGPDYRAPLQGPGCSQEKQLCGGLCGAGPEREGSGGDRRRRGEGEGCCDKERMVCWWQETVGEAQEASQPNQTPRSPWESGGNTELLDGQGGSGEFEKRMSFSSPPTPLIVASLGLSVNP